MSIVRSIMTMFRFKVEGNKLAGVDKQIGDTVTRLQSADKQFTRMSQNFNLMVSAAQYAVGIIAGSRVFRLLTTDFANQADQIDKIAPGLGLTAQEYLGLGFAAQSSGLQIENVTTAMAKLGRKITEAAKGNKETKKVFKELGIDVQDAAGRLKTPMQMLLELSDAISGLEDPSKRQYYLMKFFEESGPKYVAFMNLGAEGIRKLMTEAERLGLTLDQKAIKAAVAYKDATLKLKTALLGLRNALAMRIIPTINNAIERFVAWWRENDRSKKAAEWLTRALKVAGLVLAGFITHKMIFILNKFAGGVIKATKGLLDLGAAGLWAKLKLGLLFAGLAMLVLLIQDLIVFARGGDSLIGEWLGDTKEAKGLRSMLLDLGAFLSEAWKELKPALKEIWGELKRFLPHIWDALKPLLPYLKDIIIWGLKAATVLLAGFAKIVTWVTKMRNKLGDVWEVLQWLIDPFTKLRKLIWDNIAKTKTWKAISETLGPVWDKFKDKAGFVFDKIISGIKWMVRRGLKFLEPIIAPIRWLAERVGSMFGGGPAGGAAWLKGRYQAAAALPGEKEAAAGAMALAPMLAMPSPAAAAMGAMFSVPPPSSTTVQRIDHRPSAHFGGLTINVQGSADMTAPDMQEAIRKGARSAFEEAILEAFSDYKEPA